MANRRQWLQRAGIALAGASIMPLRILASPWTGYFAPELGTDTVGDTVRLCFNENPYGPSKMALEAMGAAAQKSNRYPWDTIHELIEAIAVKHTVSDANVLLGAGSTQIIDTTLQYAARQKGNFVLPQLTFNRWAAAAEQCGLQKIAVPLTGDKQIDLSAMEEAINANTRMVYICNPNNPTGSILDHDALVAFIEKMSAHTLVVIDEAYLDYTRERSLAALAPENKNLVVIKTFSKIYGLAGARIGYALGHKDTIDTMGSLQSGANMPVSAVSMAAALASLKDNSFVEQSYSRNEQTKIYTVANLKPLNIKCITSHTNFIYFSLTEYKNDFFARLKTHNIEGTGIFEESGKWSRITVGTQQEMEKFIAALR